MAAKQTDPKQHGMQEPSRTLPALPKFHELDTDSQDQLGGHGGPAAQFGLMSKFQSVLDADDEEEADNTFEDLQAALQRVIKSKAAKQQQKQQAILQDLQTSLAQQHKALESAAAKDLKDGSAMVANTFNSLNKKLAEKFKHIEALNAKYQQDLHSSWEEYNELYSQLEENKDQVLAMAEKRRAALKRKVTALQNSAKEKMAEAEKKVSKLNSQVSKLPDLSNVLQAALMAG